MAWRADRLGDISSHRGLANLVERGLYVLTAMSPDELRAVVEGPARQAGLLVEPGLVDLLVREVEGEPGALPLLSHVLRETWLRRDGRTLTVDGYRESGGIRGAVAQSAEDVYSRIDPDHRQLLRDLLLRLVAPGAEGQPVRARLPRRLVVTDPAQDELIDLLVGSRWSPATTASSSSRTRRWPGPGHDCKAGSTMTSKDDASSTTSAASPTPGTRSVGRTASCTRGMRLVQAVEWSRRPHPELTPTERTFLRASQRLAAMEERTAADRARHQARMVRRLRALLVAAAVLLVAALGAGSVAARQRSVADANASAAEENAATAAAAELAAVAGRAGARALSTDDVDVSLLLAAAGARLDESPQTRANLLAALAQRPQLVGSTLDEGDGINGLGLSPDGSSLATYDRQSRVHLYDTSTWQVAAIFDPDETRTSRERVAPLAFTPDGRTLAVGMPLLRPNPVRLLDADTLRPVTVHLRGTTGPGSRVRDRALGLDYSADGRRLAATFHRLRIDPESDSWEVFASRVLVWDMADAHRPLLLQLTLAGRDSGFRDRPVVALSPDGRQVYTSKPLAAYDVESGRRLWRSAKAGYVMDASPDGRTLAVDADHDVRLLDAATGHLRRTLHGHDEDVLGLRFSADGELLASAAGDGLAIVWDAQTGAVREQLSVAETNVYGLVFSPDDRTLYTAGYDHVIRRWDLTGRSLYISRVVPPRRVRVRLRRPGPRR
jgi:hypothetical protein